MKHTDMTKILTFDFEAFLQKHFGLKGKLRSDLDASDPKVWEEHDLEEFYTKEAWDAWQRAIDLFDDMEEIGLIPKGMSNEICTHFCDNA